MNEFYLHQRPKKWAVALLFFFTAWLLPTEQTHAQTADLSVNITTNSQTYAAWTYITFFVTVKNNSATATVSNVKVNFPVPAGTSFSCSRPSIGTWISWDPQGVWSGFSLSPNDSAKLQFTAFAFDVATITANASCTSTTAGFTDPITANNSAAKTVNRGSSAPTLDCNTTVVPTDSIDLEVVTTANTTEVPFGQPEAFVIKISNRSNKNATGVRLQISRQLVWHTPAMLYHRELTRLRQASGT